MKTCIPYVLLMFVACGACGRSSVGTEIRHAEELVGIGEFENAIGVLGRAVQHETDRERQALLWLKIADLYSSGMRNETQAFVALNRVVALSSLGDAGRQARERRAVFFEKTGEVESFITEMGNLTKYYPRHPLHRWYRLRMAEGFLMADRWEEARAELRELLAEEECPQPLVPRILFDLGETYALGGEPDLAKDYYYTLIRRFPESALAAESKLKLAGSVEELGYAGTAYRLIAEAARDYPNPAAAAVRLESLAARGSQKAPPPQP